MPCDKCQWGYGHGVNGEEMALDLELNDNGLLRVESKAEKQEAGVRGVAPVQPVSVCESGTKCGQWRPGLILGSGEASGEGSLPFGTHSVARDGKPGKPDICKNVNLLNLGG